MTNIELDVARSTVAKNRALTHKLENVDWEQRLYEIAKEIYPTMILDKTIATYSQAASQAVIVAKYLIDELGYDYSNIDIKKLDIKIISHTFSCGLDPQKKSDRFFGLVCDGYTCWI